MIRKAKKQDISRVAEILVFTKRMNFRSIFHDDQYSFGELQVLTVAQEYIDNLSILDNIWVYDDEFVKGLIHVEDNEIKKLYVDTFFESKGIGGKLIEFAIENLNVQYLWALEKNNRALAFYKKYGFDYKGTWQYEEGTTERLLKLER